MVFSRIFFFLFSFSFSYVGFYTVLQYRLIVFAWVYKEKMASRTSSPWHESARHTNEVTGGKSVHGMTVLWTLLSAHILGFLHWSRIIFFPRVSMTSCVLVSEIPDTRHPSMLPSSPPSSQASEIKTCNLSLIRTGFIFFSIPFYQSLVTAWHLHIYFVCLCQGVNRSES